MHERPVRSRVFMCGTAHANVVHMLPRRRLRCRCPGELFGLPLSDAAIAGNRVVGLLPAL